MKRSFDGLLADELDLLVIGGGIFGACALLDAAQRGLRAALVEKGDFCSATSAQSYKLIHGGLRYLQHGDLYRVRMSSNCRRAFLRIAPHLVQPLPIVVPTYGHGRKSRGLLLFALRLYEALTADRNRGIADPDRRIPPAEALGRDEVLEAYPGLEPRGLTGAVLFHDGQIYNPARLVLAFVRSAVDLGALAVNYAEVTRIQVEDGRVRGAEVSDRVAGVTAQVRARSVINAAGPYADRLLRRALGHEVEVPGFWSRDAYFVLKRPLVSGLRALSLEARTRDPDALLSRGGRHLFLVPWRGYTLCGVWHRSYEGDPDGFRVTEEELAAFVDEINGAYSSARVRLDEVSLVNAGLIPFGENDGSSQDLRFGHRSTIVDHGKRHGIRGLISLVGVRFTTGVHDAPRAVRLAAGALGRKIGRTRLHDQPLLGGDISDFEVQVARLEARARGQIAQRALRPLTHNHGSLAAELLEDIEDEPELGRTIGGSTVLRAEVLQAARREMAVHLSDVVLRRTDLGSGEIPSRAALEECAELAGRELGWTESRKASEIDEVLEGYPAVIASCAPRA
jgi:glycerol-3-phosphate dehydrogenase